MTPKCCQNCASRTEDGNCSSFGKRCERWRLWFHKEWENIQKAAERIKKNTNKENKENEHRTNCEDQRI